MIDGGHLDDVLFSIVRAAGVKPESLNDDALAYIRGLVRGLNDRAAGLGYANGFTDGREHAEKQWRLAVMDANARADAASKLLAEFKHQ